MIERPTVAFITTSLIVGGQERAMVDLAVGLNGGRFRTIAITTKAPGPLADELRAAGIPVHAHLLSHKFDLRVVPRLVRLLREERVRIVYTVGSGDKMFWGRLCARLAGVPVAICAIHKTRSADGSAVISRMNRWLMGLTDCVLAVGQAAAEYLHAEEGVPRDLLRVIYNGVDDAKFSVPHAGDTACHLRAELGLDRDSPLIGIVAALRPEKDHENFLMAARQVHERHPSVHFVVIGDGSRRSALEERTRTLGLAERAHFLGARADVPRLLPAIDIMCLSSKPLVETLPISILEGMAASKPAVVTDVGSLREMVLHEETGLLVPPGDPGALAAALGWMLDHPAERRAMGRRARAHFLAHFTMDETLRRHEALFAELLARKTRTAPAPSRESAQ